MSQMRAGMQIALTLVTPDPAQAQAAAAGLAEALAGAQARVKEPRALGPGALDLLVEAPALEPVRRIARGTLAEFAIDVCVQPWEGRRKALFVADMDSTIIGCECLDELADFAGKKAEVSAVTEAAMRGEIDYRESLRRRLALMGGLDARVLARVFGERLLLSDGARELLEGVQQAGLRTAILSGGFTYFTERLRIELGFDFATSNELEISGGKLTGRVVGDIVDAAAKAHHLARLRDELGLRKDQVIACGDGANDLMMMAEAGLSVAYRAKPATRAQADVAINFGGLDSLLNLFD
jgi:phosphoserine phosphatase